MSSILFNNLSSSVQSILSAGLKGIGLTSTTSSKTTGTGSQQSDSSQLSPFAQLMSTLQELQQSDPTKYQQVTQQIAANLKSAAATATADGNTSAATQLNTLATDFTNASQSGQLPDVLDLAKAIGGGHHHHHSASSESASGSNSTTTTSGTGSSSDISELLSQLQAAFQSNSTQTDSLDPMAIIFGTLSSSGVSASASS